MRGVVVIRAHTFVWAQGWWAPEGAGTTAWYTAVLGRSAELGLPRVRYSRWWQLGRAPTLADVVDHPSWGELVAEAREGWRPPVRDLVPIPEWAFVDARRSRNRWPDEFRALARAVGLNRSRESGAHLVPVETPRKSGHLRQ